jgi:hypothetical protein
VLPAGEDRGAGALLGALGALLALGSLCRPGALR